MDPNPATTRPYTVVVGLDASPRAAGVLEAALQLCRAHGGQLVLVRAVGVPIELPHQALSMPPGEVPALLEQIAERDLASLSANLPGDVVVSRHVHVGVPWSAVVEEAKACHADVIVVGSHGYHVIDRLLGTTAAKIVNHAPCSVFVVR